MLLVFLLLLGGIIRIRHIKDLANWFSQNMGFLFVPACVEVMDYFDLIAQNLIPILVIGAVTTFSWSLGSPADGQGADAAAGGKGGEDPWLRCSQIRSSGSR